MDGMPTARSSLVKFHELAAARLTDSPSIGILFWRVILFYDRAFQKQRDRLAEHSLSDFLGV